LECVKFGAERFLSRDQDSETILYLVDQDLGIHDHKVSANPHWFASVGLLVQVLDL
jgi:hypothetical protein